MLALAGITAWHWTAFVVLVVVFLALDLGVFHRKAHVVSFREAGLWTFFWFCLAMGFGYLLFRQQGREIAELFVTGYIVELSLSMDNVFVIALIFSYFRVPPEFQHRVLFWGILGALGMRGVMIWLGSEVIERFHWTLYLFGGFLVFTGIKMLFSDTEGVHPEKNPIVRLARRFFPVTRDFVGQRFVVWEEGRRKLTPLALVLIMVETTDLVFALDSIPAIFGITTDEFIVFTSNVFAILGLRSLYFVLAGAVSYFQYLKYGLSLVLVFIGVKMCAELIGWSWLQVSTRMSLLIVGGIILISIAVSLIVGWWRGPGKEESEKSQ